MNKKSLFAILAIFIIPILAFWGLTFNKSEVAVAKNTGKPQVIKFSSTMCLECKQVEAIFKELMPKYSNKIDYVEVIVDSRNDMNNDLIEKYDVSLVPTIVFLNSDGTQNKRVEGAQSKELFENEIKALK